MDNQKYFICHVNLAQPGQCKYESRCRGEHVNRGYVWKILKQISGNISSPNESIANRNLKNDECEQIEKAYSCPTTFSIQLKIFDKECLIDFEKMIVIQNFDNESQKIIYSIKRTSTKSNYKKDLNIKHFVLMDYLTEYFWYVINPADGICEKIETFCKERDLDSKKMEKCYSFCFKNQRYNYLLNEFKIDFKSMILVEKSSNLMLKLIRRPKFR